MGIFDGCLLASDIDGTLIDCGYINERCIDKIKYFVSEGGFFSIATGRSVGAIGDVLRAIDCVSPSVVANGAVIYDYQNHKPLYQHLLHDTEKNIIKEILEYGAEVGIEIHIGEDAYLLSRNQESDDHERYEGFEAKPTDFDSIKDMEWNKVIYMFTDPAVIEIIKSKFSGKCLDSRFMDTTAFIDNRQHFYLEQVPLGVSKASAIQKLSEILQIKDGCVFAIGDYYNDVPMLESADICAAPENSPDDIKNMVNVVVSSAKDGAVADFIDYLTGRILKNDD